jgi:hypothetical protein
MAARLRALVRFRLDGTENEIDLNAGHAQALRDVLSPCACGAAGRGRCVAASPGRSQGTGGRGGQHGGPRVDQRAGHRGEGPRTGAR